METKKTMEGLARDYRKWCEDNPKELELSELGKADDAKDWDKFIELFKVLGFEIAFNHIFMMTEIFGTWNFVREFDEEYNPEEEEA
jgi:hypothetical protein